MCDLDGAVLQILGNRVFPYTTAGYGAPLDRPEGIAEVLTPAPTLATLAAGYRPALHASAGPAPFPAANILGG